MIWLIARKIRQPLTTGMMSLLVLFRSFWASRFYDTSVHTTKNRSPKGAYVIPSVKCLLRHAGEKIYQIVGELLQSEQHLEGGSFVYTEPQRGEQHEHFLEIRTDAEHICSQILKKSLGQPDSGKGKRSRVQLNQWNTTEYS